MKKLKFGDWKNKPMTWGGYTKLCIISLIITVIYTIGYICYVFGNPFKGLFKKKDKERKIDE